MENNLDCSKYKNKDGVSCYRNSILAILQSLPIFSDHVINLENFMEFYNNVNLKRKILLERLLTNYLNFLI